MHTRLVSFLDPKYAKLKDDRREYFIKMVSTSFLREAKDYNSSNNYTDELVKTMIQLAAIEPEFILQTAYYVSQRIKITTCTNFILAFAFLNGQSQPFVTQYFNTVLNPGDVIQVCKFVQVINHINNETAMGENFPQFLKDYMMSRYEEFRVYQSGKQCSNINRKKTLREYQEFLNSLFANSRQAKRKAKLEAIYKAVKDTQNQDATNQARQHVKQRTGRGRKHTKAPKKPANYVFKDVFDMNRIIGFCRPKLVPRYSRYTPSKILKDKKVDFYLKQAGKRRQEAFHQIKDEKIDYYFEQAGKRRQQAFPLQIKDEKMDFHLEQAGKRRQKVFPLQIKDEKIDFKPEQAKRMQVPVPVLQDRVLSFKNASKQQIWTDLLTKNQIPYKAMLRNLRNILKADLDVPTLKKVIESIQNPQKVQKAKIFPFQYFNALYEVDKLLTGIEIDQEKSEDPDYQRRGIKPPLQGDPRKTVRSNQMEQEAPKKKTSKFKLNAEIGQELKIAIQNAMQIAVEKNLDEILGQTYVFCDVSVSMSAGISGGKKYGSIKTCGDCGFVFGNMIKQKCQKCEFYLFGCPNDSRVCSLKCEVDTNILEGFNRCQEISESIGRGTYLGQALHDGQGPQLGQVLQDILLQPKAFADTIIILSNRMIHMGYWEERLSLDQVISGYFSNVNPNAKFFFMNLEGNRVQVQFGYGLQGKNCFAISGMSNNVLKYISLGGSVGQVQDIRQFTQKAFQNQQMQQEKPAANP